MSYTFQILDISQDDVKQEYDSYSKEYCITLYGRTETQQSIVCHVYGYEPYFYIKIPSSWSHTYAKSTFLEQIDTHYKSYVNYAKLQKRNSIKSYKEFYGYHVDDKDQVKTFQFLKLSFQNNSAMSKFKRSVQTLYRECETKLRQGKLTNEKLKRWILSKIPECDSQLYEANIPPIITFIHDTEINPSGWVSVTNCQTEPLQKFKTEIEVNTLVANLSKVDRDDINDFIIGSFDIECDSLTGAFPVAIKDFLKPARDIYSAYYDMMKNYSEYTLEEKQCLLRNIVENVLNVKQDIPIERVSLKTTVTVDDDLDIYQTSFIEKLDQSIHNKKIRDSQIQTICQCLSKLSFGPYQGKTPIQGDPIIQIGTVFYNYMSKTMNRVLIVMSGDTKVCSPLEGITVIECHTEAELLLEWLDLISKVDPDFITGYNILGFDFKYIHERALEVGILRNKRLYINKRLFYNFGRYNSDNSEYFFKRCKYVDKNKMFGEDKSNGFNVCTTIEMDGRVVFDIQEQIKKGHSLDSYKLDNVSNHFMRGIITEIRSVRLKHKTVDQRWLKLTTKNIRQLKRGDYITLNTYSKVGQMMFMNGSKFQVQQIVDKVISIDITNKSVKKSELQSYEKVEWCLSKDDVPPSEIFRLHKEGGPDGRAKVGKYCIQDCELCIHLLLSLDIVPNNMGMSNVCMVPLSYIFSRGQGIKVTSVVSKICSMKQTRMPVLKQFEGGDEGFEGAIVLDPTPGIYLDDPIAVLDFASLYPSCIIEKNCSHETFISDTKYIERLIDQKKIHDVCNVVTYDNYKYIKVTETSKTLKKVPDEENPVTTCYFKKSARNEEGIIEKESMGILPTVLDHLLSSRKSVKRQIKKESNPDKVKVLDGLQLAYKVTANSVYGQLGFKRSTIFKKEIAASTTSIGRRHIYDAKRGVYEWAESQKLPKPEIVYGDTDSVFVKFSRTDSKDVTHEGMDALKYCIQCGIDAGEYITKHILEFPQDLEYEKTFYPFVLLSKKRYIGDKYETIQDAETKQYKRTSMGIVMKRRDNAPIVKYVFGNIIEKLLVEKNFKGAIQWLDKTLSDIKVGRFDEMYFIISKTLNSYYANPESIAHKVLADRIGQRDPGNKPLANERIPFMFQKIEEREPNGFEKVKRKVQVGTFKNGNPKFKTIIENGNPKYKKRKIVPGERIETPEFIRENKINLDYSYYISNQIMNPVEQLLELHPDYQKGLFEKYIDLF